MCGIAGFIDYNKNTEFEILLKMTDSMIHRGPDDSGYELFQNDRCSVGFGQRRLSIIDLSPLGHQPMFSEDGNCVIVLNGEIYNYKEIRIDLEKLGYRFVSQSDTEVVLKAFMAWGNEAVHRFIGMFAFVIYDKIKQQISIFRDRAGVKPLFFYHHNGLFMFASELKAFHQHPAFIKEIDYEALGVYFQYGYIPAPHSIFRYTQKLTQGHFLTFNLKSNDYKIEKYWDVYDHYNKPKLNITENEALAMLEPLLVSAFNYRMVADVPVGMFLSGGYDSSLVSAVLQKDRTEKIKTFTIGFHEAGFNEAQHAKKVAQYLGTDHTEYYCTTKEAMDIIPDLVNMYDEPMADTSAIPTTLVSKIARRNVTVSLSADAGDEQFGGYTRYTSTLALRNKLSLLPTFARNATANAMNLMPNFLYHPEFARYFYLGQEVLSIKESNQLNELTSKYFSAHEIKILTHLKHTNLVTSLADAPHLSTGNDFINRMLAVDYKTYMVDDILTKVDRATMSVSLEGREPLLDHRIIEFAAQLPAELKVKGKTLKYLLKQLTHKYIPIELMDRPKQGFGIHITKWLNNELKPLADEYLNPEKLTKSGIYNTNRVMQLKNYCLSKEEKNSRIWFFLFFEMWKERWM